MLTIPKLAVLFVIVTLVKNTIQQIKDAEFMKTLEGYHSSCATEQGMDLEYIKKAWIENRFPSDNQNLKCYFKCVNIKLGVMDDTGKVKDQSLHDVAIQLNDQKTGEEIVNECGQISGADLCQTAFDLMICIRKAQLD